MKLKAALPIAAMALLISACDDNDSGTNPTDETGTVVIQFDNMVGGLPLTLDTETYTNAAGNAGSNGSGSGNGRGNEAGNGRRATGSGKNWFMI